MSGPNYFYRQWVCIWYSPLNGYFKALTWSRLMFLWRNYTAAFWNYRLFRTVQHSEEPPKRHYRRNLIYRKKDVLQNVTADFKYFLPTLVDDTPRCLTFQRKTWIHLHVWIFILLLSPFCSKRRFIECYRQALVPSRCVVLYRPGPFWKYHLSISVIAWVSLKYRFTF